MSKATRTCVGCQQEFLADTREIKRGNARFCSHSCCSKNYWALKPKKKPNSICALCNKPFYKTISKRGLSRSGLYFCCRAHKDEAQRIGGIEAIQPTHYRGKSSPSSDYRQYAFNNLPYQCNRCGFHDKRILVVHHKDHNRENNDISNLEILCPNCHAIEHWFPDQK